MATDNGDGLVGGVGLLDLGDEARGTDDVKGGDTEETLGVVDTAGLVDLRDDGDGGVDLSNEVSCWLVKDDSDGKATYGVGDDEDVGLGRRLGGGLGKVTDDGGVGVEEVCSIEENVKSASRTLESTWESENCAIVHTVTGHAGLARNTGRDEDDLRALESITETGGSRVESGDGAVGVDVADISGDTWIGRIELVELRRPA